MSNNAPDYEDNLYFEKAKTMENLTEQWKKGELPEGWYYVQYADEIEPDKYESWYDRNGVDKRKEFGFEADVQKVIAKVPSYEKLNEILESEEKSHLQADSYYNKILEIKDYMKKLRSVIQSCSFETDTELKVKIIRIIDNILRN